MSFYPYGGLGLADFESEDECELSFAKGEQLLILQDHMDGWLLGCVPGYAETGLIPKSFVKRVELEPVIVTSDFKLGDDRTLEVKKGERLGVVGILPTEGGASDVPWALVVRTSGESKDFGPGYCPSTVLKSMPKVACIKAFDATDKAFVTIGVEQKVWLLPGDGDFATVLCSDGACGKVPRANLEKPPAEKAVPKPRRMQPPTEAMVPLPPRTCVHLPVLTSHRPCLQAESEVAEENVKAIRRTVRSLEGTSKALPIATARLHTERAKERRSTKLPEPPAGPVESEACNQAQPALDGKRSGRVEFTDCDGDKIAFAIEGGKLIKYVNGKRLVGENDSSGVVTQIKFTSPADIRDQHGWGCADLHAGSADDPADIIQGIMTLADSVAVSHNIPADFMDSIKAEAAAAADALRVAFDDGSVRWQRAKLVVVGGGGEGKSAMVRALSGKPFEITGSTIGADTSMHELERRQMRVAEGGGRAFQTYEPHRDGEQCGALVAHAAAVAFGEALEGDKSMLDDITRAPAVAAPASAPAAGLPAPVSAPGSAGPAIIADSTAQRGKTPAKPADLCTGVPRSTGEPAAPAAAQQQRAAEEAPLPPIVKPELVLEFQKKKEGGLVLTIIDNGGQPVFGSLNALFFTSGSTIFAGVFSLKHLAADKTQQRDCIAVLAAQLNAVSAHVDGAPPLLLVGTHRDSVPAKELAGLSTLLEKELCDACPAFKGLVRPQGGGSCFWAIENSRSFDDLGVQDLATTIGSTVQGLPALQRRVPLPWLRVYDELRRSVEAGVACVSLADVMTVAARCGLPHMGFTLKTEVEVLLGFLHSLGALLWYGEPYLREMVVLDPQWVLDAVCCVVRNFRVHECKGERGMPVDKDVERKAEADWQQLTQHGRLRRKLLSHLWESSRFKPHCDDLLLLMVRHSLAVPLRGEGHELLVPPLLGLVRPVPQPAEPAEAVPLCTLLFMLKTDDRRKQLVWEDLQQLRRGFLPISVYNRLCAELISWSYHTAFNFEPSLSCTHLHIAFGRHRLLLARSSESQPSLAVTLLSGGVAAPVLERLRLLLRSVLERCPQLCCPVLLPLPGADGVLIEATCLAQLDAGQVADIQGKSVEGPALQRRFDAWLPSAVPSRYHAMMSYRWSAFDKPFAECLFDILSSYELRGDPLVVFLDRKRLKEGETFDFSFMRALDSSRVIVPIVSWAALQRMTSLQANSAIDNVLLEWSLAVEMHKTRGVPVLPILVGTAGVDGTMTNLFTDCPPALAADGHTEVPDGRPVFERVPDVVVTSVITRLDEFLKTKGDTLSAEGRTRTAAQVVTAITKLLGVTAWELAAAHGGGGIDGLWKQWGLREAVARRVLEKVTEVMPAAEDIDIASHHNKVDGLAELLESCEIGDRLADALAWCHEQGVNRTREITELSMVSAFVESLQLKPARALLLRKGLGEAGSPLPTAQSSTGSSGLLAENTVDRRCEELIQFFVKECEIGRGDAKQCTRVLWSERDMTPSRNSNELKTGRSSFRRKEILSR